MDPTRHRSRPQQSGLWRLAHSLTHSPRLHVRGGRGAGGGAVSPELLPEDRSGTLRVRRGAERHASSTELGTEERGAQTAPCTVSLIIRSQQSTWCGGRAQPAPCPVPSCPLLGSLTVAREKTCRMRTRCLKRPPGRRASARPGVLQAPWGVASGPGHLQAGERPLWSHLGQPRLPM